MREHRLDIAGHTLVAHENNENLAGPPLLYIHGITGSVGFGEFSLPPSIRERYRWISLSLPGHFPAVAPADFTPEGFTPDRMARLMSEAVEQLTGGRPAVLIGHSTGGYASLCVAQHAPQLVQGLLLVSAFALGKWSGALGIPQWVARLGLPVFRAYFRIWQSSYERFRFSFRMLATDQNALRSSASFARSAQQAFPTFQQVDAAGLYPYFRRMPQTDIREWLTTISCPAHILHGDRDRIIPPAHAEEMQRLLPNCGFTWIEGSGHLPMLEREEAYNDALETALQTLMKAVPKP